MKRLTAVALVLLLAVPAPVVGAPAHETTSSGEQTFTGAQPVSPDDPDDRMAGVTRIQEEDANTTNRLSPTDSVVSTRVSVSSDMSQMLTEASDDVESRFRTRTAQQRLSAARSPEARTAVARATLADIERRTEGLKSEERGAIRAYANGSISANQLLQTLANVHTRSQMLQDALDDHARMESSISDYSESARRSALDDELAMLQTPVRERLGEALDGSEESTSAYVDASSTGVVVETLDDGEYLREAIRFDNTDDSASDSFDGDTSELLEYTQTDLYPWAFSNNPSISFGGISQSRYRLTVGHPQGTVSAYIDGSTRKVFRETQRLTLDELPRANSVTASEGDLNLTINRTPNGGPIRFNVTNGGDPVDATVRVNGDPVGQTGSDGVLWSLQPRSYYLVTVSSGSTTVNATITSGSQR